MALLNIKPQTGSVTTAVKLNVRKEPFTRSDIVEVLAANTVVQYDAIVDNVQTVNNNSVWYRDTKGNFIWSGGVK